MISMNDGPWRRCALNFGRYLTQEGRFENPLAGINARDGRGRRKAGHVVVGKRQHSTVNCTRSDGKRLIEAWIGTPCGSVFSERVTRTMAPGDNCRSARSAASACLAVISVDARR